MSVAERIERHRDFLQLVMLFLLLFVAHAIAFSTIREMSVGDTLRHAFAFALPPVIIGWVAAVWLLPWLPKTLLWRGILLVPMAFFGSVLMFGMTKALLGIPGWASPVARLTGGPAELSVAWQIMQGMAYYFVAFLFGVICEMDAASATANAPAERASPALETGLNHLLVRSDGGIVAVHIDEIIRLEAAGDYCEIITPTKKHLARMSMAECEEKLAAMSFLRVHRSHMINLKLMVEAEPAGNGRLQATMANGDRVLTSRSGAQLLRTAAG